MQETPFIAKKAEKSLGGVSFGANGGMGYGKTASSSKIQPLTQQFLRHN